MNLRPIDPSLASLYHHWCIADAVKAGPGWVRKLNRAFENFFRAHLPIDEIVAILSTEEERQEERLSNATSELREQVHSFKSQKSKPSTLD